MNRIGIAVGLALFGVASATADVAVVVEKQWTIGNNYFSAFAHDPLLDEFRTGGYSFNQDIRWSHVLDDSVEPWVMEGDILLNWFQLQIFYVDGFPSNSGNFDLWGMVFNPLDGRYFLTGIGRLKPPFGSDRLDSERDLIVMDDRLPDSLISSPTYAACSNVGGTYSVTDTSTDPNGLPRAAFLSSGVQPGDRITLFPVDIFAEVESGTFTVTQVVSETELRVDRDPCWYSNSTVTEIGYILSLQPHLTLKEFREEIPYYADDLTEGPKANYAGALTPDGLTLFLADQVSDNLIAVDTQVKDSMTVYVDSTQYRDYVLAQIAAGRHQYYIRPVFIYLDESLRSGWADASVGATLDYVVEEPNYASRYEGEYSLGVTFNAGGDQVDFQSTIADPEDYLYSSYFADLEFALHGGATGGQQLQIQAYDLGGAPGATIAVPTPVAGAWTYVTIPASSFGVTSLGGLRILNAAAGAQPTFYIDDMLLRYTDPPPGELGDFDPNSAGAASAQLAMDANGRLFFSEGETDDIVMTTDGATLTPFLTSNEIASVTQGFSDYSTASTGVQVMGMAADRMGTVYWSDNRTRAIWKAPRCGQAENIRLLAGKDEIQESLGLPSSPRGMNNFTLRGTELLTFNFVDGNFIYKVDMNTYEYGDFDEDVDVDGADLGLFESVMKGPDDAVAPIGLETLFGWADLDLDSDVDLLDAAKLQCYGTGELPPLDYD